MGKKGIAILRWMDGSLVCTLVMSRCTGLVFKGGCLIVRSFPSKLCLKEDKRIHNGVVGFKGSEKSAAGHA